MGLQVVGDDVAQMAVEDGEQAELVLAHLLELSRHVVFHGVMGFPFHQVEPVGDVLVHFALPFPRIRIRRSKPYFFL